MDKVLRMNGRYLNERIISEFLNGHKELEIRDPYSNIIIGTFISLNNATLVLKVQEECKEIPLLEITRITKL